MSFVLKRLELSNIRVHEHIVFEPLESGVTAIKGSNGSGKSTIVDSVAWLLFGTKPGKVSKNIDLYRKGAVFPDDAGFVEGIFCISDVDYAIRRKFVTKGGSVECTVEKINDSGGRTTVAGPAVSHAEEFIRKLIKMNEKSFLSTVFVQQKQVDQLISASPKDRAETIEKLIGVKSITASIDLARTELNTIKQAVKVSTTDSATLEELKEKLLHTAKELKMEEEKLVSIQGKIEKVSAELRQRENKHNLARTQASEREKLESQLRSEEEVLSFHTSRLTELMDERKALKAEMEFLSSEEKIQEITSAHTKLETALSKIATELGRASSQNEHLETKILELDNSLKENEPYASVDIDKTKSGIEKLTEAIALRERGLAQVDASIASSQQAIQVMSEHDKCPTCLQSVKNREEAVLALKKAVQSLQEKSATLGKSIDDLRLKLNILEDRRVYGEKYANDNAEVVQLKEQLEKRQQAFRSMCKKESELNMKKEKASSLLSRIQGDKNKRERYAKVKEQLQVSISQKSQSEEKTSALKEKLSGLSNVKPDTVDKMFRSIEKLRESKEESNRELVVHESGVSMLRERERGLSQQVAREEENAKKYRELLQRQEELTGSLKVLSEFKDARVDSSVPVIESFASDLFGKFTEGRFIKVNIGTDFKLSVEDAGGSVFPVEMLSGGELSAASIALRLAVSLMLGEGSDSLMLILDEILVSQDVARADIILNTVKSAFPGQVIIIAHNESVDNIVDKVIELDDLSDK